MSFAFSLILSQCSQIMSPLRVQLVIEGLEIGYLQSRHEQGILSRVNPSSPLFRTNLSYRLSIGQINLLQLGLHSLVSPRRDQD